MKKNVANILVLLMITVLSSHCRFTRIAQPAAVAPGASVPVNLTVAIDIVPEPNAHKGVLCLLLPEDWSVNSATYSSPHASGTLAPSAAWTAPHSSG